MATLKNHPGMWLRDDAAASLARWEAAHGKLGINSAGRTVAEQQQAIDRWNRGGPFNRPPYLYQPASPASTSNHVRNGGVAIDTSDITRFKATCAAYGWRHPYPTSDPVHFEYNPALDTKAAKPAATGASSVRWVQERLKAHGFNPGTIDGIRGPKTLAAIRAFQKARKLAVDGIVGPKTNAALKAAPPVAKPVTGRLVRRGSTGALVRAVQAKLKANYALYAGRLVVDGNYGPATEAAVREFQRRSGLKVDGIAGPATLARLGV